MASRLVTVWRLVVCLRDEQDSRADWYPDYPTEPEERG